MKAKLLLAMGLTGFGMFNAKAQTDTHTATISSLGWLAGTGGTGNTFYGYKTGSAATSSNNTFLGYNTGSAGSTGGRNVYVGAEAGMSSVSGNENVFVGYASGKQNVQGLRNVYIGTNSGTNSQVGQSNVCVGWYSGYNATAVTNGFNTFLGVGTGYNNTAWYNTFVGANSGYQSTGEYNVFLGYNAGRSSTGSNQLYIDNSSTSTPLVWGDFTSNLLKFNGKVGVGEGIAVFPTMSGDVNVSAYKLFVNGGLLAKEVRVETTWADYVFDEGYSLPSLTEVEAYIKSNGHLPNMPSAKRVEADGIEVGQMAKLQQEKIEELTLYAIEQNKLIEAQRQQLDEQAKQMESQQKQLDELSGLVKQLMQK